MPAILDFGLSFILPALFEGLPWPDFYLTLKRDKTNENQTDALCSHRTTENDPTIWE